MDKYSGRENISSLRKPKMSKNSMLPAKCVTLLNEYQIRGASLDLQNGDGLTPLMYTRDLDKVKALLSHRANVNTTDEHGNTALHIHVSMGHQEIVQLLLSNTDINTQAANYMNQSALFFADQPGILKMLLLAELPINSLDVHGNTATHAMASRNNVACVQYMLTHGADVTARNHEGQSAVFYANDAETLQTLLAVCDDINVTDSASNTLLHTVAKNVRWKFCRGGFVSLALPLEDVSQCLKVLLEHKIDPAIFNKSDKSALEEADGGIAACLHAMLNECNSFKCKRCRCVTCVHRNTEIRKALKSKAEVGSWNTDVEELKHSMDDKCTAYEKTLADNKQRIAKLEQVVQEQGELLKSLSVSSGHRACSPATGSSRPTSPSCSTSRGPSSGGIASSNGITVSLRNGVSMGMSLTYGSIILLLRS